MNVAKKSKRATKVYPYPASTADKKASKLKLMNWFSEQGKNIGTSTRIRDETVEVKDDVTGKVYTMKTMAGKATSESLELHQLMLVEAPEPGAPRGLSASDLDGLMTDQQVSDIKKLIRQGSNDLTQQWKNALELTNKAFQVMQLPIPLPEQKEAWNQYQTLLSYSVRNLARTRGQTGNWRLTGLGIKP